MERMRFASRDAFVDALAEWLHCDEQTLRRVTPSHALDDTHEGWYAHLRDPLTATATL